ncbi:MAG: long-chain acyl-CoA synthetase, partial [Solirubrobacteraceae bacterium]|nr:long-chain acyl-CoA synthetase [Solirubrobacteraceae bacterium]
MTASARRRPDHVAVKLDDAEVTYGLMDEGSARVAGILREHGIGPGDRVGVMLPNVPYFPLVYFGIVRAGAVVVPMNVLLKGREVGYYLEDSGAKLLFAWHGFAEAAATGAEKAGGVEIVSVAPGEFEQLLGATEPVRELADVDGGDTAVILYTSGTTGQPKGAELTHDNLKRNAELAVRGHEIADDDVLFGGLPLFHTFGQTCCMNAATFAGATLTLLARFEPAKALEIIQRDGV